ncbi:MAG: hydantoinase B/oxoprolinase family protein, partial [Alphaproteobacteria bacterium]|nr:hydantoinase B/oxoprolinase family protein [Alphaproteobacteria bacterium]
HSRLVLRRAEGEDEEFHGPFLANVHKGDMLEVNLPSGGGFGDPMDRDPALVQRDVAEGKVTVAHAAAAYGVAIDPDTQRILERETADLRTQ